jgi:hypothetical protein
MCFGGLSGVMCGVLVVAMGRVRVMRGLFVCASLMVFGGLAVVMRSPLVMFRGLAVMSRSFLRHDPLPSAE